MTDDEQDCPQCGERVKLPKWKIDKKIDDVYTWDVQTRQATCGNCGYVIEESAHVAVRKKLK